MDSITYPLKTLKIMQAVVLLMALQTSVVAAEKDVWQIVFDFQMKLAQQGNAAAQEKVAEMFEEGRGVKQDFAKASYWYRKAASQGHSGAINKLKGLPERIRLSKATKADKKAADADRQQLERQRAVKEKAAREKALREQQAAERKRAAREKALREQRAAERKKAAQEKALREQQAAERKKAALEKARQRRSSPSKAMREKSKDTQARLTDRKQLDTVTPASNPDHGETAKQEEAQVFKADPCKSKAARFMSTCKNK